MNNIALTSLEVAEVFGKKHKSVLRDIRELIKRNPEYKECFLLTNYTDKKGEKNNKLSLTLTDIYEPREEDTEQEGLEYSCKC